MGRVFRFGGAVGWTLVLLAPQVAGATKAPPRSHVQVIGYRQVALTGSEDPLVVNVSAREAVVILRALQRLPVTSQRGTCVEALNAFQSEFCRRRGRLRFSLRLNMTALHLGQ
jgi:hypothetical protein